MTNHIRRINLFGGPGSGKSTLATRIFSALKIQKKEVELVREYIKTWAHQGKVPQSYDSLYVFAKQLQCEDLILRHVPLLVTDSPLLLNSAYPTFDGFVCADHLVSMAQQFDRDFPSLNFYIKRTVEYQTAGRYQDESQAIVFDNFLQAFLKSHLEGPLHTITVDGGDSAFEEILNLING